ncbi:hypothetical protein [Flavobacterium subsaxonicum]|uniref:HMA domain-containing protein n=1 Tax=Flavobacterium subsaxonicum WB 4.1-42 = DSM 21790 TaxID=1121898 RepID=A0A0A2MQZ7_9FLAO|nr:hypothetical protein [Flavobacterium subsaxonicum]KGO93908.1 hypothetical protein Q766_05845 [Flavobacterium subsaxonicum WB 4.1-42 = DSM 21790]
METTTQLYIFKTDIGPLCANCEVHKTLSTHAEIQEWSIDTDDVDCVLRVASATLTPQSIIALINALGHQCHEL